MLGGFSLQLDARTVPPISSRTAASLLAFVILRRERAQTRDLLAGRFWSDLSEDKARRRLSNALWMIRNAGREAGLDDLLRTTSTTIGFNPAVPVEVDVEKFEQRLDSFERSYRTDRRSVGIPELTEIVDSYQGDLLAGHYDEWIDDQRKKTRERYLAALSVLVQMNIGEADYESALRHARALVAAEPLSEEWHRSVMRLYALNSQPSAAERQYGQCRDILSSELGVEPSPETTELHERLRTELAAPLAVFASATDEPLPFVGRATERSALLSRANELVSGKGGVILIEGQPGIGKSRLVEEVSKGAEWRGVPVLIGYHSPTSALNPYEGLKEALGPSTRGVRGERLVSNVAPIWIRQASTVLDDLPMIDPGVRQPLRPEEEPWRTTEALVQVILALGRPKPLMIVLEDVHWCDEDTMAVLVQLGDRLIDSGILICLSYQRHEAQRRATIWRGLNELEAKPGSSRHVLPPLEDDEVRQLVTAELGPGRMSGQTLTQLVTTTAGNPYVIVELLRSPIEVFDIDAFTSSEASSAASGEGELMPRLLDILSQRIDSASHEVQAVLDVISAMSGPASTKVVAGVMGLELGSAASALAEAVELTFLVETPRGCEFAQEQTRRTVYDRLGAEARRQLHGAIVDSLVREQRAGVGQLAHHAWLAEQWPRAYQYHSLAAESALKVHAYHTTAEHFGKADLAAQSAHIADDDRIDDLFAYERVLDILGRRPEQQALLDRLSGLSNIDPVSALLVRHRQGWLLAHTDRGAEAARLAADGVEPARQAGLGVGELLTIVGCARAWSGDMHGAIEPLREAVYELSQ